MLLERISKDFKELTGIELKRDRIGMLNFDALIADLSKKGFIKGQEAPKDFMLREFGQEAIDLLNKYLGV